MNLISYRPKYWNGVVGQEGAVKLLQSLLTLAKWIPRGFLFEGSYGVGKSTTALITARALLCMGTDPLGCGTCNSCQLIESEGIDAHPDFRKVLAASKPGVQDHRDLLVETESLSVLSRRRVLLIDEAHRLSREAWDVYLEPLEKSDTNTVFMFVTNNSQSVPETIRSRCSRFRFGKVSEEIIFGLLAATAAQLGIPYNTDALRLIAKRSEGAPRNAMNYLGRVASMGTITSELVETVIDTTLETKCTQILQLVVEKKQVEAAQVMEELGNLYNPTVVLEALFGLYAKAVFEPETNEEKVIRAGLSDVPAYTTLFIKWSQAVRLPADALNLFLYELMFLKDTKTYSAPIFAGATTPASHKSARDYLKERRAAESGIAPKPQTLSPEELEAEFNVE
jgi:DNA polymerase III subunit gamma/tau